MVRLRTAALVTGLFCLGAAPLFAAESKPSPFLQKTWDRYFKDNAHSAVASSGCSLPTGTGAQHSGAFLRGARSALLEQEVASVLPRMKRKFEDKAACREYLPSDNKRSLLDFGQVLRLMERAKKYYVPTTSSAHTNPADKASLLSPIEVALRLEDASVRKDKREYIDLESQRKQIAELTAKLRREGKSKVLQDAEQMRLYLHGENREARKKEDDVPIDYTHEPSAAEKVAFWQLFNDQEADYACCLSGFVSGRRELEKALRSTDPAEEGLQACKDAYYSGKDLAVRNCSDSCAYAAVTKEEKQYASCMGLGMLHGFHCDPWFDQEHLRICAKDSKPVEVKAAEATPAKDEGPSSAGGATSNPHQ